MPNTQKHIDRVCEHRGIPPVRKGMDCVVDGHAGTIVGGNHSGNFNVKFNDNGDIGNCHPYWRFQIFTSSGELYYDHEQGII
jgi:hypothetical protein